MPRGSKGVNRVGHTYGKLTVIERAPSNYGAVIWWKCRCECGTEKAIPADRLKRGQKSCGCIQGPPVKDLSGQRFGRLVAQKSVGKDRYGNTRWRCQCDCGRQTTVSVNTLSMGHTRSCGCLGLEAKARTGRKNRLSKDQGAVNAFVSHSKARAKLKGIAFDLSNDEVRDIIKRDCVYCGAPPAYRKGIFATVNGMDRVDSSKGYTLDNVVPCCTRCNRGKLDCTLDEFKDWIARVHKHMGLQ